MSDEKFNELSSNDWGFVYILINASMPGTLKIGYCKDSPKDRAVQLSSATGVPTPFIVVWTEKVPQLKYAERKIHLRLKKFRVNKKREFFCVPLDDAIRVMRKVARKVREQEKARQELLRIAAETEAEKERLRIAADIEKERLRAAEEKSAIEERKESANQKQLRQKENSDLVWISASQVTSQSTKMQKSKKRNASQDHQPDFVSYYGSQWTFAGGTWILRRENPIVPDFTND